MIRFLEANGYDVSYIAATTSSTSRLAAAQPQAVRLERPRRVLVRGPAQQRRGCAQRRREPRLLHAATRCSGRRAGSRASTAATRPTARWSPTRTRTSPAAAGPGRVDGDVARPALHDAGRERDAGERPDRPVVHRQHRHVAHHGAVRLQEAAPVAQHGRDASLTAGQSLTLAPDTLGYEWDVGRRQRLPSGGLVPLSSTTRERRRGVHRLRQHHGVQRHGDAQPDDVSRPERRARVRRRDRPVGVGAGRLEPDSNTTDRNMQQATREPVRRHGRAAHDSADRARPARRQSTDTHGADLDDHLAADDGERRRPGHAQRHARRTPAAVVAGVEVSTDGGSTWHPASGTTSWTYTWTAHGSPSTTIKCARPTTAATSGAGRRRRPST